MEGSNAVFEQLLSEKGLYHLMNALEEFEEPTLAAGFRRAQEALHNVGFYDKAGMLCEQFGQELQHELDAVDRALAGDTSKLWALDEKLAQLVRKGSQMHQRRPTPHRCGRPKSRFAALLAAALGERQTSASGVNSTAAFGKR
jgi:ABC-type transport system involved in cytochrome c biogenesis ATPase subunit